MSKEHYVWINVDTPTKPFRNCLNRRNLVSVPFRLAVFDDLKIAEMRLEIEKQDAVASRVCWV